MARIVFSAPLDCDIGLLRPGYEGRTVAEVFRNLFADHPPLRGLVLDERGALRKHIGVCVDGQRITDLERLTDIVTPTSELFVFRMLTAG